MQLPNLPWISEATFPSSAYSVCTMLKDGHARADRASGQLSRRPPCLSLTITSSKTAVFNYDEMIYQYKASSASEICE